MEKLNKLSKILTRTIIFKKDILLTDILNVIKNETNIDVSDLQSNLNEDYEFIQGLKTNYPFMINEIMVSKGNGAKYYMVLIMNKNIKNVSGIVQDNDAIVFDFNVKPHELENIIINLIPYF